VNTSAGAAYFAPKGGIKFETLRDCPERKRLGTLNLYAQSKLGNILFSNEFARRFANTGIRSNALNPGYVKTELQRHANKLESALMSMLLHEGPKGALTQLWAGTSPETVDYNGAWFIPWARVGEIAGPAADLELAQRLWAWIEEQRKSH